MGAGDIPDPVDQPAADAFEPRPPDGTDDEPVFPNPETIREYALAEARKGVERGWSFTPLKGKDAYTKGWQKAPTPSIEIVEEWIAMGNVGLRTGIASGIFVIDDDSPDGSATAALDLPPTVTVITGSDKRHFYFRASNERLGNREGNLPDKVNVRGDGGQVVFVGSIHPDTGGVYRWAPGCSPDEVELAELPANVLDLIRTPKAKKQSKPRKKRRPSVAIDESARKALNDAAASVACAPEGTRNSTLNREAFRMGRWINAGLITRREVEDVLADAARAAGLEEREVTSTLHSGLDAGCSQPFRYRNTVDPRAPRRPKPSITLEGGALPRLVTSAEDALLSAQVPLFQRGSLIVRTMRARAMTMRDVYRRVEGVLMLFPVDSPHLVEILTTVANWYKLVRDDLVLVDCPERIARTYLARAGHWRLRSLLGVIETPTLRPDGSMLSKPGYDAATCLWFDPGSVEFPTLPEEPTREDALLALAVLMEVIKAFPWLEDCDRSAALAAILTALIRHSLRTAPMFAFRAPKMASGKSLLADVVAMIATGRVCSVMTQGKDEDEDKKRMLAILVEGMSVACIDNIERPFGGAALCSILTQESWRERILGKTGTATVPTTTTWLATGNNLHFVGDIVTRVVVSDLDPKVEKPEERVFDVNLHEYVPANRGALVAAGLTVLRAYRVAGSPSQGLPIFGRFEEWSDWVRSSLVWLGLADPCAGRARLYSQDPVGSRLRALLIAWHDQFGSSPKTVAKSIKEACLDADEPTALHQALSEVAPGTGGKPDSRRLGNYLSKYERRAEAGLRIERAGEYQGGVLWCVVSLDQADPVSFVGLVSQSGSVAEKTVSPLDAEHRPEPAPGSISKKERERSHRPPSGKDSRNPPNSRAESENRSWRIEGADQAGDDGPWPIETAPICGEDFTFSGGDAEPEVRP